MTDGPDRRASRLPSALSRGQAHPTCSLESRQGDSGPRAVQAHTGATDLASGWQVGDLAVEERGRNDPLVEVVEIQLFVRCVRVLVRQPDAEEHAR